MSTTAALLSTLALLFLLMPIAPRSSASEDPLLQPPEALLGGQVEAICYSGFRAGQHPDRGDGAVNPTDEEILEDLRILMRDTPFRLLRVYDSGENSQAVIRLIEEHNLPMRVMLGAWLAAEVSNPNCPWHLEPYPDDVLEANRRENAAEVDRAIALANAHPETVMSVAVGNEALVSWTDHLVPADAVIRYVRRVKSAIRQPVTVADNYGAWIEENGIAVAAELDFVSVHIYPVWEGRGIGEGISYGIECMERVRTALPNAQLVITEAGWATTASEFGGRASQEHQLRYYNEVMAWAASINTTVFFFEAFDESWKGDPNNPMGAEKHWGLYFEDRTPKLAAERLAEKSSRRGE